MENELKIKVVNKLTGEINEVVIDGPEKAKDTYLELSASETAIKNAKKKIIGYLDEWLGQDSEYAFSDGKVVRRVQRESKLWTIEGFKKVGLDEDAIAAMSKIDMTMAKEIVKEMVERGDIVPNAGKVLDEYSEVKATKPFLEVR